MLGTTIISLRAGHRRHHEPHRPRLRDPGARADRRAGRRPRRRERATRVLPRRTSRRRRARAAPDGAGGRRRARDHRPRRAAGHAQPPDRGARLALRARGRLRRAAPVRAARPARSTSTATPPTSSTRGAGDTLRLLAGASASTVRVAAIVDHDGNGAPGAAVMTSLARAQAMLGLDGQIRYVLVSNRGDDTSGAARTDQVIRGSRGALAPLGLELQDVKRDGLTLADQQGDVFMTIFTTFGSFSIVAGVLLIFLIFVMLSAERRVGAGHRPRGRHAPRARRADVRLRRPRLRPRRGRRRRRARRRRVVRDGVRAGERAQLGRPRDRSAPSPPRASSSPTRSASC